MPGVRPLLLARLLRAFGGRLLQATLFWQATALAHGSPSGVMWVGVVEFLPSIPMSLLAGAIADVTNRVRMVQLSQLGVALGALGLAAFGEDSLAALLALTAAIGVVGAFEMPAMGTVLPNLVTRERFSSAVALSATVRNVGWTLGPLASGFALDAWGARGSFALAALFTLASALTLTLLPRIDAPSEAREVSLRAIREGIAFVRRERVVLGAMTLDMFAVIFAGATALLPIYTTEILQLDARAYGALFGAITVGTFATSLVLIVRPGMLHAGRALCIAVAAFGVATIVFGLSRSFWLSFAALAATGMADEVSMVARNVIIQLGTPDALRGRVSSVNQIFVGASNELGAAESGLLARLTSATFSVVFGGVACLGVLGAVMARIPALLRFRVNAVLVLGVLGGAVLMPSTAKAESEARAASAEAEARDASAPAAATAASVESLRAPHHRDGAYFTPWGGDEARSPFAFLRWQFSRNPYRDLPRNPAPRVANDGASLARALPAGAAQLTWIGHATFAVQDGADVFLTDPHFGPRALLPARLVAPGIPLTAVPAGAFAVVSHNHYDHLDAFSVERLPADFAWFVPLGLASWFRDRGRENVIELDWWQSAQRGRFTITCLPSQHWSKRIEQSTNESLWCAWLIDSGERRYFFAGDTGYFHGFAEYGRRFGPIDAALLPIGAYEPRWFMDFQHMNPAEALRAFRDLRARTLFPMHWGTFDLTDEPPDEAPRELRRQMQQLDIRDDEVSLLAVGETRALPPSTSTITQRHTAPNEK